MIHHQSAQVVLVSEDEDRPSSLSIEVADDKQLPAPDGEMQHWQNLRIQLRSGARGIGSLAAEELMICRTPTDEISLLAQQLEELLNQQREQILFEPSEPSFELSFTRTRRGGIKVEAWLDAGNGTTGIYTWDACGIRFLTTDAHLRQFVHGLRRW